MSTARISLDDYTSLCDRCDIGPNFLPAFVDYYFAGLGLKPKILGKYDRHGQLVAAFPKCRGLVFPTSVHKRLLGRRFDRIAEIGQPESLFPVLEGSGRVRLGTLSPTTSGLLAGRVRDLRGYSLKAVAIARDRRHRKLTIRQRDFFESGGKAHFTDSLAPTDFADAYVRLHASRWGYPEGELQFVRRQILSLYDHVFGVLLELSGEPIAAQLCYRAIGRTLHYVDFVNSGVKLQKDNTVSYGSVMMLTCLRKAEEEARASGKRLRFSFGYYYGERNYKAVWAEPEPTFVGF